MRPNTITYNSIIYYPLIPPQWQMKMAIIRARKKSFMTTGISLNGPILRKLCLKKKRSEM